MSFVGDLEHLPIVDVIQLLHATRKSGTLCLKSTQGESQLVFNDGCIVSANHSNNSVRIGQILVQMGKIASETLSAALQEQKKAGAARLPLIALLIESGKLKKEDAFKGLETLIEMTIVEVLTWAEGTFELDVDTSVISDEYRYIPEKLNLELNLNTQNVLMDALRIYDEKKRDGTLLEETFPAGEEELSFTTDAAVAPPGDEQIISIDDLGLDVMDDLEKVIPGFFRPVRINDPTTVHREKAATSLGDIPEAQQEELFAYLASSAAPVDQTSETPQTATHALILFSASEFIRHTVMTACKQEGFFTFSTDEEENLDLIINQSLAKALLPVILLDQADRSAASRTETALLTGRILAKHPELPLFQLIHPVDFSSILAAMRSGVRAVLPKPDNIAGKSSFVEDTIYFLETIKKCLKVTPPPAAPGASDIFMECMDEISTKRELAEITLLIDRYLSVVMGRAITFVHRKAELVCENISRAGSAQPLNISIPLTGDAPLQQVMTSGTIFVGESAHPLLNDSIYSQIGQPTSRRIVVVPFKCLGRVLAVTYCDFGSRHQGDIDSGLISILVRHAGIVYENALYRKKFEKMLQTGH
jgi:hypothetical protein